MAMAALPGAVCCAAALLALAVSTSVASAPGLAISPSTSQSEPLTTRSLQFTATAAAEDAGRTQYFLLETVPPPPGQDNSSYRYTALSLWICAGSNSSAEVVAPLINTVSNGPFPAMNTSGSVQVQVSAYSTKEGKCLGTSEPQRVYFDLRYSTLTHSVQVLRGSHNRVQLIAVPENAGLAAMTKSFTFDTFTYRPPHFWVPARLYRQNHSGFNHTGQFTFQFGELGSITFAGLVYSSNAFDLHATRAAPSTADGIFSQPAPLLKQPDGSFVFTPIAFVVPFANGSTPALPAGFTGRVERLDHVPGPAQLCLPHRKLTIRGGPPATGVGYLPLCGHMKSAKHLALKLAPGLSVVPAPSSSTGLLFQEVSKLSGDLWVIGSTSGTTVFSRFMEVAIKAEASLIGATVDIELVVYDDAQPPASGTAAWQAVTVTIVAWPNVTTPKRLITAITDAPAASISDLVVLDEGEDILSVYRRLGMSVVPTVGANTNDPRKPGGHKGIQYYFPSNRSGVDWGDGMRYGVEHSTFETGFNGPGLFCLASGKTGGIGCPVNGSSRGLVGLSSAAKALELRKWQNAVDFHNATGLLDISYDGFLLRNSFENVDIVTRLVKPDYVFTDAEHFPTYQSFVGSIGTQKFAH